jgi:hypothetical protein
LEVSATLVDPDLDSQEVALAQVGAGHYEALVQAGAPGTYLARLTIRDGQQVLGQETLGLVVPYSPEYRAGGLDRLFLDELARVTGGEQLQGPAAAFRHDLLPSPRSREIWAGLLLAAALLFPLDVALRRVMLGPRELRQAAAWLGARLPVRKAEGRPRERALGRLFQARDRVREEQIHREASPPPPQSGTAAGSPSEPPPEPAGNAPQPDDASTMDRLQKAKERARRQR